MTGTRRKSKPEPPSFSSQDVFADAHLMDGSTIRSGPPTRLELHGSRMTFWFPIHPRKPGTMTSVTLILGATEVNLHIEPVTFGSDSTVTIIQPLDLYDLVG